LEWSGADLVIYIGCFKFAVICTAALGILAFYLRLKLILLYHIIRDHKYNHSRSILQKFILIPFDAYKMIWSKRPKVIEFQNFKHTQI